ncbi:hypothetical protein CCB80_15430 [Armatimonadetes bacterium Uphvl-Ar1]|nr:hypothetical protein CCB80_15430 [Armatimonadetes bacterium Uphvl-Ar1]
MVLAFILASGQAGSAGAPVELAAGDRLIPPGLPAIISGTTFTDGRPINAKLTVTLPGGAQRTKDIPISKEGEFETEFTETEAPGVYRFVIVSADSKTRVDGQFEVQSPSTILNRVEQAIQNFDHFNDRVEEAVDDRIDELPRATPRRKSRRTSMITVRGIKANKSAKKLRSTPSEESATSPIPIPKVPDPHSPHWELGRKTSKTKLPNVTLG